jgi:hypothetical protein
MHLKMLASVQEVNFFYFSYMLQKLHWEGLTVLVASAIKEPFLTFSAGKKGTTTSRLDPHPSMHTSLF